MMFPYTDGLVEAKESNQPGWIQIDWLYPGDRAHKAYRSFVRVQKEVKAQGFKGWLVWSQPENKNMHRHIIRAGGVLYASDVDKLYFKKEMVA